MKLEIVNRSGRAVPHKFLRAWVSRMAKLSPKHRDDVLTIAFVSKDEIRRLNREFRGKDKPTDVLSFEGEGLGELAISPEVISKQAREHGLLVREELGYMVIHGFLHLLGYDHETNERDARRMFKVQDALFEKLLRQPRARKR